MRFGAPTPAASSGKSASGWRHGGRMNWIGFERRRPKKNASEAVAIRPGGSQLILSRPRHTAARFSPAADLGSWGRADREASLGGNLGPHGPFPREASTNQPLGNLNTIEQARARLGDIGNTTVYDWIKTGRLRAIKLGARTFITDAEIDRLLADAVAAAEKTAAAARRD